MKQREPAHILHAPIFTWQYSVLLHKLNGKVCIYTTNNFTKEAYLKEKIIKTKKFANMHIYS